jgi:hypothetical protein
MIAGTMSIPSVLASVSAGLSRDFARAPDPSVSPYLLILLVVVVGTVIAGFLVPWVLKAAGLEETKREREEDRNPSAGALIGRCENILAIILVMLGEYTGLGLIIAAKSILRFENRANASYYLAGTLVNLVISLFVGLVGQVILLGA